MPSGWKVKNRGKLTVDMAFLLLVTQFFALERSSFRRQWITVCPSWG